MDDEIPVKAIMEKVKIDLKSKISDLFNSKYTGQITKYRDIFKNILNTTTDNITLTYYNSGVRVQQGGDPDDIKYTIMIDTNKNKPKITIIPPREKGSAYDITKFMLDETIDVILKYKKDDKSLIEQVLTEVVTKEVSEEIIDQKVKESFTEEVQKGLIEKICGSAAATQSCQIRFALIENLLPSSNQTGGSNNYLKRTQKGGFSLISLLNKLVTYIIFSRNYHNDYEYGFNLIYTTIDYLFYPQFTVFKERFEKSFNTVFNGRTIKYLNETQQGGKKYRTKKGGAPGDDITILIDYGKEEIIITEGTSIITISKDMIKYVIYRVIYDNDICETQYLVLPPVCRSTVKINDLPTKNIIIRFLTEFIPRTNTKEKLITLYSYEVFNYIYTQNTKNDEIYNKILLYIYNPVVTDKDNILYYIYYNYLQYIIYEIDLKLKYQIIPIYIDVTSQTSDSSIIKLLSDIKRVYDKYLKFEISINYNSKLLDTNPQIIEVDFKNNNILYIEIKSQTEYYISYTNTLEQIVNLNKELENYLKYIAIYIFHYIKNINSFIKEYNTIDNFYKLTKNDHTMPKFIIEKIVQNIEHSIATEPTIVQDVDNPKEKLQKEVAAAVATAAADINEKVAKLKNIENIDLPGNINDLTRQAANAIFLSLLQSSSGGSASKFKKTNMRVEINGRNRVVYINKYKTQYIKNKNEFITVHKASNKPKM
jgi:hypothetical protein